MSAQRAKPDTFEVFFSRATDYKIVTATGAWGGLSPNGEVVFDLYIERRKNPDRMDIDVVSGKQVAERRVPDPQPFERESQVGIAVRADVARIIGQFLIGLADKAAPPPTSEKR
jgi:hypothetical protein